MGGGETTARNGRHAVFVSYASEDVEAVGRICEALRGAGIEVWFDQSELRGGDLWDQTIRQRIHDCQLFIPVVSAHTDARSEGYFRREWKLAVDRTEDMAGDVAFLVPVVVDGTPSAAARVPPKFRDVQWTRLPDGQPTAAFIQRIRALLVSSPPAGTKPGAEVRGGLAPVHQAAAAFPNRVSKTSPVRSATVLMAAAIVILGAGYLAIDRLVLSKRAAPVVTAIERSIAVLPFVDMSEKHDQEYFGDGLAEEVLDVLAKVPGLHVVGRTSSFQFKGKNADLRTVGTTLGAAHMVEGSVRRSGGRIRVTAQLVRTADGVHEWSNSYDRDAGDAIQIQREIAAGIAHALQITVDEGSLSSSGAISPAAYELFLRGRQAYDKVDKAGLEQAADYFQRALDAEPSFSRAADHLAWTRFLQADNGVVPGAEGWERARKAVEGLIAANPRSLMGHVLLARILTDYDWDWERAGREATEALAIDSRQPLSHYPAASLATVLGKWGEAESHFRAVLNVDPLSAEAHWSLGLALYGEGRIEDALAEQRRAVVIDPALLYGHSAVATDLLAVGQPEAALREIQLESSDEGKLIGLSVVYHALGRKKDSDAALAQLTRDFANQQAYAIAIVHADRGETDEAFRWLERAFQQRDSNLAYIKSEWSIRSLRDDPRYRALLQKMRLPL